MKWRHAFLAMILVVVLGPTASSADDATVKQFSGDWRGVEARTNGGGDLALKSEDLNLRISPDKDGFRIGWIDRKSTRLNSSHIQKSRMPSSA